jgi:hypothetical protein
MKNYFKFFIFASFLICFGCQSDENHQKKTIACKDYKLDVPIEAVDAETTGEKGGDTHFHSHSSDAEVFYSYNLFESVEKAQEVLKKDENKVFLVIRKGELKDNNGNKIGEKIIIFDRENYRLFWTNGAMMNLVSSNSLPAIEEIEKDCNL